jgi:hypothetical protein
MKDLRTGHLQIRLMAEAMGNFSGEISWKLKQRRKIILKRTLILVT